MSCISENLDTLTSHRSLDAALDNDDAAIRVLSNHIDGNGTGLRRPSSTDRLAAMLANLIQDGISYSREI